MLSWPSPGTDEAWAVAVVLAWVPLELVDLLLLPQPTATNPMVAATARPPGRCWS